MLGYIQLKHLELLLKCTKLCILSLLAFHSRLCTLLTLTFVFCLLVTNSYCCSLGYKKSWRSSSGSWKIPEKSKNFDYYDIVITSTTAVTTDD